MRVDSITARWAGAFQVITDDDGWQHFRRLDPALLISPATDGLEDRATMGAGIRSSWTVSAGTVSTGTLVLDAEGTPGSSPFDVVVGGRLAHRVPAAGRMRHELDLGTLRPGTAVHLWLPQFGTVRIREASLRGDHVRHVSGAGTRWLTYGSSLTHCQQADGPSETWPALVAEQYGWQLTSLGFAGECQLDPAAESTLQQLPADLISLCLGINSYNAAVFSERSYTSQVLGFLTNIRAAHPLVPMVVITPMLSLPREDAPNAVGMTLRDYRNATAAVVRVLRDRGDQHLHCVDGAAIFTPGEAARRMPDTLHPDNEGYRLMAERLGPQLAAAGE
jgi:lysophospholipase L1-like esterase